MLALALAVVPPLGLLLYFWRQDRRRPEPVGLIWKVFLMGCLSVVPIAVVELGLQRLVGPLPFWPKLFAESFMVAALTEEWGKHYVVRKFAFDHPAFDEVHDGILYTVVASLGFALLENVLYSAGNPSTGLLRAFTAVPLHALASGLMGAYMGLAKAAPADRRAALFARGLAAAVLVHGTYDFCVLSGTGLALGAFPVLGGGLWALQRRLKQVERLDAAKFGEAA